MAKLALAIAKLPDGKLRDAASALWRELYGEAATTIVDKPSAACP